VELVTKPSYLKKESSPTGSFRIKVLKDSVVPMFIVIGCNNVLSAISQIIHPFYTMNPRSFAAKVRHHKKAMRSFMTKVEKKNSPYLNILTEQISVEVWKETDCLSCANCCKKMTPTFTDEDIDRIAAHFQLSPNLFKKTYLKQEKKDTDWQNKKQPCQWLDLGSNMCSIYEIRPADCAGFPHLTKKNTNDYIHVHKQNIAYCPATYRMVEIMMERSIV